MPVYEYLCEANGRVVEVSHCSLLPLPGDDCDAAEPLTRGMDAGGRATHGAVAEGSRERAFN
jgi:hypothetical protein